MAKSKSSKSAFEKKLRELGPWHFKMPVGDGKFTSDYNEIHMKNLVDPFIMKRLFTQLYPQGFKGKSFLDIGCNSGGYCIAANQLGAKYAYGFDIRDLWINQAKFLRDEVFKMSPKDVHFDVAHIHDMEKSRKKYDITLFKGVLYHIPDPIHSIKVLADITNEVMIIDTAGSVDAPDDCMKIFFEKPTAIMAGVDNMAWLPGSPKVVEHILHWAGFKETRVASCKVYPARPHMQRMRIIAAREKKFLRAYDRKMANKAKRLAEAAK